MPASAIFQPNPNNFLPQITTNQPTSLLARTFKSCVSMIWSFALTFLWKFPDWLFIPALAVKYSLWPIWGSFRTFHILFNLTTKPVAAKLNSCFYSQQTKSVSKKKDLIGSLWLPPLQTALFKTSLSYILTTLIIWLIGMVLFINIIYTVLIFLWLLVVIPIAIVVACIIGGGALGRLYVVLQSKRSIKLLERSLH